MKEMCRIVPQGSCLKCGGQQFIVAASHMDLFLTNKYGETIDTREVYDRYRGRCCTCGAIYDMVNTHNGFIPSTPLRKIIYGDQSTDELLEYIKNPMEEKHEDII